jgi:ATP-dependent RNA circularization protein (DNA/RNA ligase family)
VLFVFVLLKLVLNVPLCDPVFDELLELVLLGEAAVGTRCPYCKRKKEKKDIRFMIKSISQQIESLSMSSINCRRTFMCVNVGRQKRQGHIIIR